MAVKEPRCPVLGQAGPQDLARVLGIIQPDAPVHPGRAPARPVSVHPGTPERGAARTAPWSSPGNQPAPGTGKLWMRNGSGVQDRQRP
jgi:hypothetical protein